MLLGEQAHGAHRRCLRAGHRLPSEQSPIAQLAHHHCARGLIDGCSQRQRPRQSEAELSHRRQASGLTDAGGSPSEESSNIVGGSWGRSVPSGKLGGWLESGCIGKRSSWAFFICPNTSSSQSLRQSSETKHGAIRCPSRRQPTAEGACCIKWRSRIPRETPGNTLKNPVLPGCYTPVARLRPHLL